jgi:signal transduction histidine kinase
VTRSYAKPASDAALALLFLAVDLAVFWDRNVTLYGPFTVRAAVVVTGLLGYSALVWRSRAPMPVFAFMILFSLAVRACPVEGYYPTVGIWLALYTVAARKSGRIQWVALLATAVALAPTISRDLGGRTSLNMAITIIWYALFTAVAWCLGRWRRANQLRLVHAQREKEAREALTDERVRIARELHDIVAHSVTIMLLQAAGARRVMEVDPRQAAAALGQVENVGSQAMAELRRMLMLLRTRETAPTPGATAGLADLDGLLARVRAAGVPVELAVQGRPHELDPGIDLAAYRTVQEALTNVSKHAGGGASATVSLRWGDDLRIEVTDDGNGIPHEALRERHDGHGLRGLEERLAVARGRLNYGPRATGGFRVTAWLPIGEPARVGAIVR